MIVQHAMSFAQGALFTLAGAMLGVMGAIAALLRHERRNP